MRYLIIFLMMCSTCYAEIDNSKITNPEIALAQIAISTTGFADEYIRVIDLHLATKLGDDMRKNLEDLKRNIQANKVEFSLKKKAEYEKSIADTLILTYSE